MANFADRMIGAAKLKSSIYEEVEADATATLPAMVVVLLASLGAGIGQLGLADASLDVLVAGTIGSLVGWVTWAFLIYLIGTNLLPMPNTRSNLGELLRTTGFAQAPGVVRAAAIMPVFGGLVWALASIWMLVAMVVAVRQALDYTSTLRAVGVCLVGWVISVFAAFVIMMLFAQPVS